MNATLTKLNVMSSIEKEIDLLERERWSLGNVHIRKASFEVLHSILKEDQALVANIVDIQQDNGFVCVYCLELEPILTLVQKIKKATNQDCYLVRGEIYKPTMKLYGLGEDYQRAERNFELVGFGFDNEGGTSIILYTPIHVDYLDRLLLGSMIATDPNIKDCFDENSIKKASWKTINIRQSIRNFANRLGFSND